MLLVPALMLTALAAVEVIRIAVAPPKGCSADAVTVWAVPTPTQPTVTLTPKLCPTLTGPGATGTKVIAWMAKFACAKMLTALDDAKGAEPRALVFWSRPEAEPVKV